MTVPVPRNREINQRLIPATVVAFDIWVAYFYSIGLALWALVFHVSVPWLVAGAKDSPQYQPRAIWRFR